MAKKGSASKAPTLREQRKAVRQGATPDRADRNIDKHGADQIEGIGGTGGSSGAGGVRANTGQPAGAISGIGGADGQNNIDRRTGKDYREAVESPDTRRAGKSRRQEVKE